MRETRARGFTLIELATVVAIIGVLATVAIGISRYAQRNASLGSATHEFIQRLRGLRSTAMVENRDYAFVFADSATGAARKGMDCGFFSSNTCARWWVLRVPATWTIGNFSPTNISNGGAEFVDSGVMPTGIYVDNTLTFTPPAPFGNTVLGDPDITTNCSGAGICFAIRFQSTGTVSPVYSGAATPTRAAFAFGLASGFSTPGNALDSRVVLVSFPSGIVKVFTF